MTFNQRAAAERLDNLDRADSDADAAYMALLFATTSQARTAFDTTSGEIYATLLARQAELGITRTRRLIARGHEPVGEGWGLWGGLHGLAASSDTDGNASRARQDGIGSELGIDYRGPDNMWGLGVSLTWTDGKLDLSSRASVAETQGWNLGAFARYGTGHAGLTVSAAADYSAVEADVNRDITIVGLSRKAKGSADLDSFAITTELRYGFGEKGEGLAVGPVISLAHVSAGFEGVDENGAGSLNLSGAGSVHGLTRYSGGLFANWQSPRAGFDTSVQYVVGAREFADVTLALDGAPGTAQAVRSAANRPRGVLLTFAGQVDLGGGWTLAGETRAVLGPNEESIAGTVSVGWRF